MYSVTSAAAMYESLVNKKQDSIGLGDDAFSSIFGSSLKGGGRQNILDMLSKLSDRFPQASVKEGAVGSGTKGTEEAFGDKEGDQIAVETSALAGMFGNSDFAKKVEDAIAAFLEGTNAQAPAGSYSQRTVSVSITVIRFSVSQRSADTGELQTSNELKTELHDKLKEMINKFFGVGNTAGAADETDDETDAKVEETSDTKTGNSDYRNGFGAVMWSMELFYSSSYISSTAGSGQNSASMQSWQFSGSFSSLTTNFLPQAISQGTKDGSGLSGGPFTSLLEGVLSGFGLASDGVGQVEGGFFARLRESRNLMAELMELYGSRIRPEVAAPGDAAGETDATEAADEAAETVDAATEAAAVE